MKNSRKSLKKLLVRLGISSFVFGSVISLKSTSFAETVAQDTLDSCITQDEIIAAQKTWGDGIVAIGNAYQSDRDYQAVADNLVTELYDYDEGKVLFKPTKASEDEFRLNKAEAISYFVKGVVPELKELSQKMMDLPFNLGVKFDLKTQA